MAHYYPLVAVVCAALTNFTATGQQRGIGNGLVDFSLDPLSPEVPTVSAADILSPTFPFVVIPSAALALMRANDVTSFSYGNDHSLVPDQPNGFVRVQYSVTRGTVGLAGSAVAIQAAGNGAAGDVFELTTNGFPPIPAGPPILMIDAPTLALTPLAGPGPESNIDGLDIHQNGVTGTFFNAGPVYFCVDAAAATALTLALGVPVTQATVLVKAAPGPIPPVIYATPAMLGLVATDVIDALAVFDPAGLGVLDPGDLVYVSLAPGSPSAAVLGTASLIEVFPAAPPVVRVLPAGFGLLATDDLDAVTIYDPCPGPPTNCPANIVNGGSSANSVDVDDLLAVIIGWGPCPAPSAGCCPANIVNSGSSANHVDVDDLLAVISGWGPCP